MYSFTSSYNKLNAGYDIVVVQSTWLGNLRFGPPTKIEAQIHINEVKTTHFSSTAKPFGIDTKKYPMWRELPCNVVEAALLPENRVRPKEAEINHRVFPGYLCKNSVCELQFCNCKCIQETTRRLDSQTKKRNKSSHF